MNRLPRLNNSREKDSGADIRPCKLIPVNNDQIHIFLLWQKLTLHKITETKPMPATAPIVPVLFTQ